MTSHSLVPMARQGGGMSYADLVAGNSVARIAEGRRMNLRVMIWAGPRMRIERRPVALGARHLLMRPTGVRPQGDRTARDLTH